MQRLATIALAAIPFIVSASDSVGGFCARAAISLPLWAGGLIGSQTMERFALHGWIF